MYFKNLGIVLEHFQVCQWNTALWEKRKSYWFIELALPKAQERYDTTWQNCEWRKITFSVYLDVSKRSESTACYQKSCFDYIVALCILLKKRLSYSYRCKDMFPLFGQIQLKFVW